MNTHVTRCSGDMTIMTINTVRVDLGHDVCPRSTPWGSAAGASAVVNR
jgi:hypothetical protein